MWADQEGQALVYRRVNGGVRWDRARFRPFVFALHLDDLAHLGRIDAGTHDDFAQHGRKEVGRMDRCKTSVAATDGRAYGFDDDDVRHVVNCRWWRWPGRAK